MSTENFGVDLWALGCIVYKFFEGKTPFEEESENKIFEKIHNQDLRFSCNTPKEAQDLIKKLLVKDASERLGFCDIQELKKHSFFNGIDFNNIHNLEPPNDPVIIAMTKKNIKTLNRNISHAELGTLNSKKVLGETSNKNSRKNINNLIDNSEDNFLNVYYNKS